MKVLIECSYCGHRWTEVIYDQRSLIDKACLNGNCRDKNLIVKDLTNKTDYYKGSPPFPVVPLTDRLLKGWPI